MVDQSLARQVMQHATSASTAMWRGIAQLQLGRPAEAQGFLEAARFLEIRPFYVGMIDLWLGKCADIRGEHAEARRHYNAVLAGASALYHQEEARGYLNTPYRPR